MGDPLLRLIEADHSSRDVAVDDDWLAYLEEHGLLRVLGRSGIKPTVVELDHDLWRVFRRPVQTVLPGVASTDRRPRARSRPTAAVPPRPATPADFLQELRKRRREAEASRIEVAGITLPGALRQFAAQVQSSSSMLELTENWDGEGGSAYEHATWRRAARLVLKSAANYWRVWSRVPPAPIISPGPDGSVDISWTSPGRKILLNVPPDPTNVASFYGRDLERPHQVIKGEIDPSIGNEWLVGWLLG